MAKSFGYKHRPSSMPLDLDTFELDDVVATPLFEELTPITDGEDPMPQTLEEAQQPDDINLLALNARLQALEERDLVDPDDDLIDLDDPQLTNHGDAPSITDEAQPLTYINLTRNPVTLDGVTHEPRPVRFQPVWDRLGQHSTLMGYSAEADSLPYIDDNTIAILPRGVSSLGLLEYIERAIVIDAVRGPLDARTELELMRYFFLKEPLSGHDNCYHRFIGGAFTIEIEDGPDLKPVQQAATIESDGHVCLPFIKPSGACILVVPNDGRIIDACQSAYPHCYVAVLDEPQQGQRTRLFLVRGPKVAENRSGEGLMLPRAEHKAQPAPGAYELQQRLNALEIQISMLHERETERNAFILGLSNTVDSLQVSMANLLDLQHPASSGVDQLLGTREDVKQHSKRLHSLENSQQSLSELIRHTMTDMSRLEGRLERKFNAPTGSIPITNQSFSDDLLAQVHKLVDDLLPEFKKIQKAADESKRQWMRNIDGVEGWLFHIHDQTIVVVDIDGNLIDSDTGYDWKLIDGPTPATLPAANGPEGD